MNASYRKARRIIAERRAAAKNPNLHTMSSHCRTAGLDPVDAGGVGGALRSKAKSLGLNGRPGWTFTATHAPGLPVRVYRYTAAEFAAAVTAYRPVAPKNKAAKQALAARLGLAA
ncbi:hypothetical protein [Kitasatospora cineracea]|uniref:Uncharacterized protein n=1 Tax=Kitasatospora cineracea TaxID=88074 RepID=A0A3N4SEQ6_9ACTN|nr:hypothetical protein [Kitasatospora cineracea]RPE34944.1 hypothetical protein EDD38_3287 [Kitasatospora cineracea]